MIRQTIRIPRQRCRLLYHHLTAQFVYTNILATKQLPHVRLYDVREARIARDSESRGQFSVKRLRELLPLVFSMKEANILQRDAVPVSS